MRREITIEGAGPETLAAALRIILATPTEKATDNSAAAKFARIIAEQYGTTKKAASVPDVVQQAAHKAGIPADKLLAALHDLADGGKH